MDWPHRLGLTYGYRYFPRFSRMYIKRQAMARIDLTDEERFKLMKSQTSTSSTHQKDKKILNDDDFCRLFLRSAREAFVQGFDGFSQDAKLDCSEFGFRIEDIRKDLPVRLWYGSLDTNVPVYQGEQIALRLGDQAQLKIENETHLSLTMNCMAKILEDLAEFI